MKLPKPKLASEQDLSKFLDRNMVFCANVIGVDEIYSLNGYDYHVTYTDDKTMIVHDCITYPHDPFIKRFERVRKEFANSKRAVINEFYDMKNFRGHGIDEYMKVFQNTFSLECINGIIIKNLYFRHTSKFSYGYYVVPRHPTFELRVNNQLLFFKDNVEFKHFVCSCTEPYYDKQDKTLYICDDKFGIPHGTNVNLEIGSVPGETGFCVDTGNGTVHITKRKLKDIGVDDKEHELLNVEAYICEDIIKRKRINENIFYENNNNKPVLYYKKIDLPEEIANGIHTFMIINNVVTYKAKTHEQSQSPYTLYDVMEMFNYSLDLTRVRINPQKVEHIQGSPTPQDVNHVNQKIVKEQFPFLARDKIRHFVFNCGVRECEFFTRLNNQNAIEFRYSYLLPQFRDKNWYIYKSKQHNCLDAGQLIYRYGMVYSSEPRDFKIRGTDISQNDFRYAKIEEPPNLERRMTEILNLKEGNRGGFRYWLKTRNKVLTLEPYLNYELVAYESKPSRRYKTKTTYYDTYNKKFINWELKIQFINDTTCNIVILFHTNNVQEVNGIIREVFQNLF